jgi:hypothetical protein
MLHSYGHAPTWLYSFVDLAFLMLIAFSQVDIDTRALQLAEIEVPRVPADATRALPENSDERAVVRVHPPTDTSRNSFSLVDAQDRARADEAPRIDARQLSAELAALREHRANKPLLAPHEQSLTRDMLVAVATVDAFWPSADRTATIAPVSALR